MILYSTACEFLNIPTSDSTAGALTVTFDGGDTWHDLEAVDATNARVRVAGPDHASPPAEAVVLPEGIYRVFVRFITADETAIRRLADHLRVIPIP